MSRLKAVDPKSAEPAKPKILIFGKPGVGKTWTSLDFPKVYYIDSEGGANLDHYTDKLKKSGGVYFGPDQGSQDWSEVIDQVKALATEDHQYKTLVIDSVSKIFNSEIAREAEKLGDKDAFGASKKPAIKYMRDLINWIDRLDMNVILICHEKAKWAGGEQDGVTFDAWEKLEYELHLCLHIQKHGSSRKAFVTKSRLQQFESAPNFEWSFNGFSKLYGEEIIQADVKKLELANPEQILEFKRITELLKVDATTIEKWLDKAKASTIEDMDSPKIQACIDMLTKKLTTKEVA